MKDKLYNIIREMILDEMPKNAQGNISKNIIIVNIDKANRLKELFANSDSHKWISEMIDMLIEAGETGVDRNTIIKNLARINSSYKLSGVPEEIRSLEASGVLAKGGLSRPKKEKAPSTGKRGRPAKSAEPGMMSDLRAAMQSDETEEEEPLNESFNRMKKLAGII